MSKLSSTPISVLDLAPVATDQTAADAFKNSLLLAQCTERWGYNRYWVAEHHNMPGIASSATSVLVGYLAANTSTIRVGSGGVMLPNHAPLVIAEQFGTLESMYPGRIDLGLGRAPGTDPPTSAALRRGLNQTGHDFPQLLSELMRYLGPSRPEQEVRAYPGTGLNVPLWLLGSSTFSAGLAAQLGLPFSFASHFAPDELLDALHTYRDQFKPSQQLKKPYAMVGVPVIVADTEQLAQKLATTTYQKFLALIRGNPIQGRPAVDDMDAIWTQYEKAAVMSRLAMAVVGSPREVRDKLERILEVTGADELIVVTDVFRHEDRLRSYQLLSELKETAHAGLSSS